MAERLHQQHERGEVRLDNEARKEHERLMNERERGAERSQAERADQAQKEVEQALVKHEREKKQPKSAETSPAEKRQQRVRNTRQARDASYKREMKQVRSQLPGPSAAFSKVIHAPIIEKTSDAVGATVARPNAILFGSMFAFFLTGGVWLWARYAGYPLSGFESIGAFIIGWIIGIIVDYVRIMVTGKNT